MGDETVDRWDVGELGADAAAGVDLNADVGMGLSTEAGVEPGSDADVSGSARPLILLAFACHPDQGSEPGAGWVALKAAAELRSRIHLVTRAGDDGRLEERIGELPAEVTVHRVGASRVAGRGVYARYFDWLPRASRFASRLAGAEGPCEVHHVTYASDWLPSPLGLMRRREGDRWVWGPVGGATRPPVRLVLGLGAREWVSESLRTVTGALGRTANRVLLRGKVDVVAVLNSDTAHAWRRSSRVVRRPNAVVDYDGIPARTAPAFVGDTGAGAATSAGTHSGHRVANPAETDAAHAKTDVADATASPSILYAGRGVAWKGLPLALRAMRHLPEQWQLDVCGGGTAALVERAGMADDPRVSCHGAVDHAEAMERMAAAQVFVLPSLHDSAPWAAAEAAGVGVPVVCLDLGGVADMAGDLARVVPAHPVGTLPERLADAIRKAVAESPEPHRPWTFEGYVDFLAGLYGQEPPRRSGLDVRRRSEPEVKVVERQEGQA